MFDNDAWGRRPDYAAHPLKMTDAARERRIERALNRAMVPAAGWADDRSPSLYGYSGAMAINGVGTRGHAINLGDGCPVGFVPYEGLTGDETRVELRALMRENVRTHTHTGMWQASLEEKAQAMALLGPEGE